MSRGRRKLEPGARRKLVPNKLAPGGHVIACISLQPDDDERLDRLVEMIGGAASRSHVVRRALALYERYLDGRDLDGIDPDGVDPDGVSP